MIDSLFYQLITNFFELFAGGRELPDDLRQKVQTDGSLVINPVQKSADSGVYTCWARNKQGHSARRSGEVTVIGKKLRFVGLKNERIDSNFIEEIIISAAF